MRGPDVSPSAPQEPPPPSPGPRDGWRRIVFKATNGLINPGPSAAEKQETAYETTIGSALHGNYKVGVLGFHVKLDRKAGLFLGLIAAAVQSYFAFAAFKVSGEALPGGRRL